MKTKRKEKVKKEEKKRSEAKRKRLRLESNPGPSMHWAQALPLGHMEHTNLRCQNFIIKTFEPY